MSQSLTENKPRGGRVAALALETASGALWSIGEGLSRAALRLKFYKAIKVDFRPRPDDIFVVTYPKSGTTWMQMIMYQLATDGSMEIDHIGRRCPYFEAAIRFRNFRADFDDIPAPRIFKTHLAYEEMPRWNCKYIYVARHGKDVLVSFFNQYRDSGSFKGTLAQFTKLFLSGRLIGGSWFRHVAGWYAHRDDENVLFLTFEDLKADLESCVRRIADFCGFVIDEERMPTILERCSFAFMKQHESKFDPEAERSLHRGTRHNNFIRSGRSGEGKEVLGPAEEMEFEAEYRKHFGHLGRSPEGLISHLSILKHDAPGT